MSAPTNLTIREEEVIRILKTLGDAANDFVVIGGYAVSALGVHRFSVDCDLVTEARHVPILETGLRRAGYSKKPSRRLPKGVVMHEYAKPLGGDSSSVELFVDNVVSRATSGTWTYRIIHQNSVEAIVLGVTSSTPSRVVGRNLLAAMKLHASRDQDLGDVVVLSEGINWDLVAGFAACGVKDKLASLLDADLEKISSRKFAADLKSSFTMRGDVTPLIERSKQGLTRLKTRLAELDFKNSL